MDIMRGNMKLINFLLSRASQYGNKLLRSFKCEEFLD
jgi:hypothetical protein